MPSSFPEVDFRAFGIAAARFFPGLVSDEVLYDPLEKRRHFDWSWQAVRYRYRSCAECSEEFKALVDNAGEAWNSMLGDEELTYKLERCIYFFFMSALSVFDSFALSLYFLGNAIQPTAFPDVANPRKITRAATHKALRAAFPQDTITGHLGSLQQDARFASIDAVRNLLAHRISGRRSVRSSSTRHEDGRITRDFHEETWHIPGALGKLVFDKELLQRHLADITDLLSSLAAAARAFAEAHQTMKAKP
ncbi:MAG: hypothetical protein ACHQIK_06000 [Candidatus Acidiferrales bacterium]